MKKFFRTRFCFYVISIYCCGAVIMFNTADVESGCYMLGSAALILSLVHFFPWLEGYVNKKTDFRHLVPDVVEKVWRDHINVHQNNVVFYDILIEQADTSDASQMALRSFLMELRDKEFKNQINAQFSLGSHLENQK